MKFVSPLEKEKVIIKSEHAGAQNQVRSGEGVEKTEPSCTAGRNAQWHSQFGNRLAVPQMELPYDSANGSVPKRNRNICPHTHKKPCT